jgi:uncharacterized protein
MADGIHVEVAAGLPDRQVVIVLEVPEGTTALEAVERADLGRKLPEHEIAPDRLGIFGRRCRADQVLADGDRVEVYRPLKADPKEVRRQLAELERHRSGRKV